VTVLVVLGVAYLRSPANEAAAPARPAQRRIPAGRLQTQAARSYTHTHLWQAASALAATIGDMRRNAVAVWADERRGTAFGVSWAGPFHAPTLTAQASALAVLTTQIP
jgi:hypothetical protein